MEQTLHINFAQFNSLIALVDYFNTEDKCKAAKHFDYNDVLSLSTIVDIEYRKFHSKVYYEWYTRNSVA